jgi:deoxyribose-phosphate aldolase
MNISSFIDHTILKQSTILHEVDKLCDEAMEYHFAAVCIPPVYVKDAAKKLAGSTIKVATVIGFPFGYTYSSIKSAEAEKAIRQGAQEIDMVINVAALKNGDFLALETEIKEVSGVVKNGNAILKVIIESGILTSEEIITCCKIYSRFPVHFLKTSTGFAEKGASVEAVQLMRQHLPSSIQIKASGGIRDYAFAKQLVDAGATRLGCSASIAIVKNGITNDAASY